MKKFATVAMILCFAGYLGAQTTESSQSETKTTTGVNLSGTLVDQGCYTTHTQKTESSTDAGTTTTKVSSSMVTECPVTTTSTSFGLLTPEGKFVRFDDAGNTRVVEMVKSNKAWHDYITGRKPLRVHVVGSANGDVVVIKEIK